MFWNQPHTPLRATERKLLEIYRELCSGERDALVAFAEFLRQRSATQSSAAVTSEQPKPIPRPHSETVVAALRRLSQSYPMLDKARMLSETSGLIAQHVMQGKEAGQVIDELEEIFERCYRELLSDDS
jgi:hypothetical protein